MEHGKRSGYRPVPHYLLRILATEKIGMKTLRIHYLQHVPFEDLGCIETWAVGEGHPLSSTRFFELDLLPELSEFDWLIVMGGPMGVYDDDKYNWLSPEKEFIRNSIQAGKTVLGICLGAQLIASALGAKVYPNREKEIGWFPVSPEPDVDSIKFIGRAGDVVPVFHWHGDTFDLPSGAIRLASSEACLNQAFRIGEKVIGLQFHLEVTEKSVERLIVNCAGELVDAKYIQPAEKILNNLHYIGELNKRMFELLDRLGKNGKT